MITHKGFVFMTPKGTYVRESHIMGHARDKISYVNVPNLDAATLFPTDKPPSSTKKQDWSMIEAGRTNLVAIKALTTCTTELCP